jgi:hypothetical protein
MPAAANNKSTIGPSSVRRSLCAETAVSLVLECCFDREPSLDEDYFFGDRVGIDGDGKIEVVGESRLGPHRDGEPTDEGDRVRAFERCEDFSQLGLDLVQRCLGHVPRTKPGSDSRSDGSASHAARAVATCCSDAPGIRRVRFSRMSSTPAS